MAHPIPRALITAAPRPFDRRLAQNPIESEISAWWSDAVSFVHHIFPTQPAQPAQPSQPAQNKPPTASAPGPAGPAGPAGPSTTVAHASTYIHHGNSVAAQRPTTTHQTSYQQAITSIVMSSSSHVPSSTYSPPSSSSFFSTKAASTSPSTSTHQTVFSASSTVNPAAAAASSKPTSSSSSSSGPSHATIVTLAVLCTIFGLVALGILGWVLYRYLKRRRDDSEFDSDSEVGRDAFLATEPQMAETAKYDNGSNAIPALPLNAHRFSRDMTSTDGPFDAAKAPLVTTSEVPNHADGAEAMAAGGELAPQFPNAEQPYRRPPGPSNGPWMPPGARNQRRGNPTQHLPPLHETRSLEFGPAARKPVPRRVPPPMPPAILLAKSQSAPQLSPLAMPEPQPQSQPQQMPQSTPEPQPMTQPAPHSMPEPMPQQVPQQMPQPMHRPMPQPMAQPNPQPMPQPMRYSQQSAPPARTWRTYGAPPRASPLSYEPWSANAAGR